MENLGIQRNGDEIRFSKLLNNPYRKFETEEEAREFENIYNRLAKEAIEKLKTKIRKGGVLSWKPTEKEVEYYAEIYFFGGGIVGDPESRKLGFSYILNETERLYELKSDFRKIV